MKHYTITVNRPEGDIAPRIRNVMRRAYNTDQWIVWDGPARKADVMRLYNMVRPYCAGIGLFAGRGARQESIATDGKWDTARAILARVNGGAS